MKTTVCSPLSLALIIPLLLAGCQKQVEVPKVSAATAPPVSAGSSVAQPAQVPASDAAIKPAAPEAAASGMASTTGGEMSKQQESAAMPMAGQVNNHSPSTITQKK